MGRVLALMCFSGLLSACSLLEPLKGSASNDAEPVQTLPDKNSELNDTGVWQKARQRGVSFRAIGQEPPWLLEIRTGSDILLTTDYGETIKQYPYFAPVSDAANTVARYTLKELTVVIREERCADVMSGEVFSFKVKLLFKDRYLSGCGRSLEATDIAP